MFFSILLFFAMSQHFPLRWFVPVRGVASHRTDAHGGVYVRTYYGSIPLSVPSFALRRLWVLPHHCVDFL